MRECFGDWSPQHQSGCTLAGDGHKPDFQEGEQGGRRPTVPFCPLLHVSTGASLGETAGVGRGSGKQRPPGPLTTGNNIPLRKQPVGVLRRYLLSWFSSGILSLSVMMWLFIKSIDCFLNPS